jgi:SpoVK/Ycf46/Vps4 family AAA+-type ATPase
MILPAKTETHLLSIEKEFVAKERLNRYNLAPKQKILLYGPPGCGKTLSAERIAWNLGLPLLKVRFDSLLSSYFGESASNLREVFDYCKREPVVLLLDECDFIAKSRVSIHDVGEVPRIVNMLLTLLDEYEAPGLVIATTNLKIALDEALFRRFDDVLEIPIPEISERVRLIEMTLSAMPVSPDVNYQDLANNMDGCSSANVVLTVQRAAKICVMNGSKNINSAHFEQALSEMTKF